MQTVLRLSENLQKRLILQWRCVCSLSLVDSSVLWKKTNDCSLSISPLYRPGSLWLFLVLKIEVNAEKMPFLHHWWYKSKFVSGKTFRKRGEESALKRTKTNNLACAWLYLTKELHKENKSKCNEIVGVGFEYQLPNIGAWCWDTIIMKDNAHVKPTHCYGNGSVFLRSFVLKASLNRRILHHNVFLHFLSLK